MTNHQKAIQAIADQDWAKEMIAKRKAASRLPYNRELAREEREEAEAFERSLDQGDFYEVSDGYER